MKADVLAVIDVYATGMQWATWIWIGCAVILTVFAAWVVFSAGRLVTDAISTSFTRATQTVTDIQQPREEETL